MILRALAAAAGLSLILGGPLLAETLKIGIIAPLTGPGAAWGMAGKMAGEILAGRDQRRGRPGRRRQEIRGRGHRLRRSVQGRRGRRRLQPSRQRGRGEVHHHRHLGPDHGAEAACRGRQDHRADLVLHAGGDRREHQVHVPPLQHLEGFHAGLRRLDEGQPARAQAGHAQSRTTRPAGPIPRSPPPTTRTPGFEVLGSETLRARRPRTSRRC